MLFVLTLQALSFAAKQVTQPQLQASFSSGPQTGNPIDTHWGNIGVILGLC